MCSIRVHLAPEPEFALADREAESLFSGDRFAIWIWHSLSRHGNPCCPKLIECTQQMGAGKMLWFNQFKNYFGFFLWRILVLWICCITVWDCYVYSIHITLHKPFAQGLRAEACGTLMFGSWALLHCWAGWIMLNSLWQNFLRVFLRSVSHKDCDRFIPVRGSMFEDTVRKIYKKLILL